MLGWWHADFSVSVKKQETVEPASLSLFISSYPLCIPTLKAKCSPSENWSSGLSHTSWYRSRPSHHIAPDCWSINGEQMNTLLATLYWNVSVWLCCAGGSVAARPVSYPAGNELCLQFRYVTGWQDILYLLTREVSIDVHVCSVYLLISFDFPDR